MQPIVGIMLHHNGVHVIALAYGAGIAQVMALGIQHLLDSGQLTEVYPDWPGETFPLHIVYPSRRHPAAKVRAFVDFCDEIVRAADTPGKSKPRPLP